MKKLIPKFSLSLFPFVKKPLILLYNLTQRCNLRCDYCFGQYYTQSEELPLEQSKDLLSQFYALGVRRLGLGGGEPLLYKDIDQFAGQYITVHHRLTPVIAFQ